MVLSTQWFPMVTSGSQWLPVVLGGFQWLSASSQWLPCFSIATSSYFGMQCHHYHVFSKCNVLLLVFNFALHCRLSLLIEMVLCKFLCTCAMLLVNNIKPPNKMHYESYINLQPAQYEIYHTQLVICCFMFTMVQQWLPCSGSQWFTMVLNRSQWF